MNDRDFSELLVSVRPHVFKYALVLLPNRADAQDVCQQTLMKAWASRFQFDPTQLNKPIKSQIINWTYTIARNIVISQKRRERIVHFIGLNDEAENVRYATGADAGAELRDVVGVIAKLPRWKQDIVMGLASGMSTKELQQLYNINEGTAKSRVFRVREQLKGMLHV